jgi:hypothetical protein
VVLPEKILFVSPNSYTVDQLLHKAEKTCGAKMLRLGNSLSDNALNKKYSIDYLSGGSNQDKERSEQVDDAKN